MSAHAQSYRSVLITVVQLVATHKDVVALRVRHFCSIIISSVEGQKGAIDIQRCSVENKKGAIAIYIVQQ